MASLGSIRMPCPVCAEGIGLPVQVTIGERVGSTVYCITSAPSDALEAEIAAHFAVHHQQESFMQPTVGRIVHYGSHGTPGGEYGKECRAAIVTEVPSDPPAGVQDPVGLAVLNPTGMFFNRGCVHHEAPEGGPDDPQPGGGALNHPGGTWHWPEQV